MRIALISDLHGNDVALEAVLADARASGADRVYCLGDVATLGPRPAEVIARLRGERIPCILGNHDAFLLERELLARYTQVREVIAAVDWCTAAVSDVDRAFVRGFVDGDVLPLDGGATLQLFHGTPRSHMEDLLATTPPATVEEMLDGTRATVMAGGHTHVQMLRQHRGALLVNPGSVGMPFLEFVDHAPPTLLPHAEYALVDARGGAVEVTLKRVAPDRGRMRAQVTDDHPLAPMLRHFWS